MKPPSNRPPTRTDPTSPAGTRPTEPRATYTVQEVADQLGLSLGSTYALIRSGKIPALRMGGRWIIPKRRLHAWLDAQPTDTSNEREDAR